MSAAAQARTPADAPLEIRAAGAGDAARWNAFVIEQEAATFFHRFEWSDVLTWNRFWNRERHEVHEKEMQHSSSTLLSCLSRLTPYTTFGEAVSVGAGNIDSSLQPV